MIDSAGNLYGSTGYGGVGNCEVLGTKPGCGTVYELSPPTQQGGPWIETIIYSFQGGNDGFVPHGDLVIDNGGNLYGATLYGGGLGKNCGDAFYQYCGTIYELSPPKQNGAVWTEQVLYSFSGVAAPAFIGDGANPNGGLVLDQSGAIYGTTQIGGLNCPHRSNAGCGTIFKLTPPEVPNLSWTENVLYRFLGIEAGETPLCGLTPDTNGNLYGTTELGGTAQPNQEGTIFEFVKQADGNFAYSILHSFSGLDDGAVPGVSPIVDAKGNLYGTTTTGGSALHGTAFELRPTGLPSWTLDLLYGFEGKPDGGSPNSSLILSNSGDIYGTTEYGGTGTNCNYFYPGCGTVFELGQ